ncbi:MAG: hypothetical protein O9302_05005 [Cyclobacteriaceae bacterium]|jgi:hypothetical protein|nr:hypothetical protein [Cytophagales bacterium]MCZ8327394.1 hypothetical protein [Cyclobacteriaceae bacterium]
MNKALSAILLLAFITSCTTPKHETISVGEINAAYPGFKAAESDPAAIEVADSVMQAMGGRKNWDNVRYFSWRNTEAKIFWDKNDSLVRVEFDADSAIALLNLKEKTGRYTSNGKELTQPELKSEKIKTLLAYCNTEINLFTAPYLLKKKGVTLKYMGQDTVATYGSCKIVECILESNNENLFKSYKIYVDDKENLVREIQVYDKQNKTLADKIYSVTNYNKIAGVTIWTAPENENGPKQVAAFLSLPDYTFKEF